MGEQVKKLIREGLEAAGKKPTRAAIDAGLSRDFLTDILKDRKQSFRTPDIDKVAQAIGKNRDQVLAAMEADGMGPSIETRDGTDFIPSGDLTPDQAKLMALALSDDHRLIRDVLRIAEAVIRQRGSPLPGVPARDDPSS